MAGKGLLIMAVFSLTMAGRAEAKLADRVPADVLAAIASSEGYQATDENNQPVQTTQAEESVRAVFMLSLDDLLAITSPIHQFTQKALAGAAIIFNLVLGETWPFLPGAHQPAVEPPSRRGNGGRPEGRPYAIAVVAILAIVFNRAARRSPLCDLPYAVQPDKQFSILRL